MIESSNTQENVESTGTEAASAVEKTISTSPEQLTEENQANLRAATPTEVKSEPSLKEKILAKKTADAEKVETSAAESETPAAKEKPATPAVASAYEPNLKYKAFGKEKTLDEFWKPLIKDAESEKKVKEIFTRADAFDDMKGRYEASSIEHQKVLQQFTSLDRDVKRVTKFLNTGDLDNFFASCRVSDDMLLQHLQRKAELTKLSPQQQYSYQQGVEARAQNLLQQESFEQTQSNYSNLAVQHRTMQLDMCLMRPEVNGAASAWDSKMGLGAFRDLVIQEAAAHYHATKQDLPAEQAVQHVLNKFGKLLESQAQQTPGTSNPGQATANGASVSQVQGTPVVNAKPVIPNVNGRGTSPIKQAPKSLDDLRKMGKALRQAESDGVVADI